MDVAHAARQLHPPLASHRPPRPGPDDPSAFGWRAWARERQQGNVRGRHADLAVEKPRHAVRRDEQRARTDTYRQHITRGQRRDEHVVNARHTPQALDARTPSRVWRAHQRHQEGRRQVEACEPQLGHRVAAARPHAETRGIVLGGERRPEPDGVQVPRAVRLRRRQLAPQALEQRDRRRVVRATQPCGVTLGETEATFDRRAPCDERGGRAGDGGDAAHRPATRRRHHHTHQGREPDERVPLGPGAIGLPQPQAGERREHRPRAGSGESPRNAARLRGAAHQGRRPNHQRHAGRRHRELPRDPQAEAHAAGGRRDAATEIAYHVRSGEHEDRRRGRRPPASRHAATPQHRRREQQHEPEHRQRSCGRAEHAQHRAIEHRG